MSNDNKTSSKTNCNNNFVADINKALDANRMPLFGTKGFNDMCGRFFGASFKP